MGSVFGTRKIDELGRLVLPAEARQKAGIASPGEVEVCFDGERGVIFLRPASGACLCCGARRSAQPAQRGPALRRMPCQSALNPIFAFSLF